MAELIAVLLGVGALIFVGYPLFKRELSQESLEEEPRDLELQKLLFEKEQALAALKELDFDYETGKLDEEDYEHLKDRYRAKTLSLLKEIDQTRAVEDIEEEIEKEVAQVREKRQEVSEKPQKLVCPQCGESYLSDDRFCPACGADLTALRCLNCGAEYEKEDKFCPSCGVAL